MGIDNNRGLLAIRTVTVHKRLPKIRRCQSLINELQIPLQDTGGYLNSIAK